MLVTSFMPKTADRRLSRKAGAMSVLACSVLCGSTVAQADETTLQRQMQAQQNQIYQLQQDIAYLRGEMEQMRYLLSRQSGANDVIVNVPSGTTKNTGSSGFTSVRPENGAGPVTPMGNDNLASNRNSSPSSSSSSSSSGGSTVTLKGVDAAAQQAYNAAYAKVQQNDLKGAQSAFKSYVETYPDNALTPNAWYWLGQVQYSQAIYDQARLSFLNVARYNESQKRPDALYKLGMISKFIGDQDKAVRYFQLVIQTYPNDAAATLASRELQRIKS